MILLIVLSMPVVSAAQHLDLLSVVQSEEVAKESLTDKYGQYIEKSDSEYKLALYSSFLFYKEFMSSQDGDNCGFTPSCSEYAVLAIKKKGIFRGSLMFFDRYTRCNGPDRKWYAVDYQARRLKDPVE